MSQIQTDFKTEVPNPLKGLLEYSNDEISEASGHLPGLQRALSISSRKEAQTFSDLIRQKRYSAWAECVLATYYENSPAKDVCRYWSEVTVKLLQKTWEHVGFNEIECTLFALGKLGCLELNLSSDVDLIIVTAPPNEKCEKEGKSVDEKLPVKIRHFQKLLQGFTDFGWAFRVDFDLRPGGKTAPLTSTVDQFINYYGNYGETWERLAFVRLSKVAGDDEIANEVLDFCARFSFRKHLDYTLFENLKTLRPQWHSKGSSTSSLSPFGTKTETEKFDLKLGIGGIRDIELFIHSMQVIHGGKNKEVRKKSTSEAIQELINQNILPAKEGVFLEKTYWYLRDLENKVQAFDDQHTHSIEINSKKEIFAKVDWVFLKKSTEEVDRIVSTLLGTGESKFSLPPKIEDQIQFLLENGFSKNSAEKVWPELYYKRAKSVRQKKDEAERISFLAKYIESLIEVGLDKNLGLKTLNEFLSATRAKATLYSLLNREPLLIKNISLLFSISPYMGSLLSRRPELLDSFLFRTHTPYSEDLEELLSQLSERRLVTEVIGAHDFLSQRNIPLLQYLLSENADNISRQLLATLKKDIFPESTLGILSMGKWAGLEMGFRSDLDFVLVTDGPVQMQDHKIARKFINLLSSPQKGGSIYEVDLRLRPSGKAGPIIVSSEQLIDFLNSKAEPWERQAYLKSRRLVSNEKEIARTFSLCSLQKSFTEKELDQLKKVRLGLRKENARINPEQINLKYSKGGFVDIEFAVQTALIQAENITAISEVSTIHMIEGLANNFPLWNDVKNDLTKIYTFLRELEQLNQLTSSYSGSVLDFSSESGGRLAKLLKLGKKEAILSVQKNLDQAWQLIEKLDPVWANR